MSVKKPDQSATQADIELTDHDLDNVTGGATDHILTLDGVEGESQRAPGPDPVILGGTTVSTPVSKK
jgi:hypothetical protein